MNPIIILIFVIALLAVLFFSVFSLFKMIFLSFDEGIQQSVGDILFSPATNADNAIPVFLSAIFASVILVFIIILGAIIVIKKNKW